MFKLLMGVLLATFLASTCSSNTPSTVRRIDMAGEVRYVSSTTYTYEVQSLARAEEETAPLPAPAPVAAPLSARVAYWFPNNPALFLRIIECESGENPDADTNPPYIGLLQEDPVLHYGKMIWCADQLGRPESFYDSEVNLCVGSIISDKGSQTGAWPVCQYH